MPTQQSVLPLQFDFHPSRSVAVTFNAPNISSDGGVLLLSQLDRKLNLIPRFAALVSDARDSARVVHPRVEQLRQRVFGIALGYEDQNDANALRSDPLLRAACGRLPDDARGLSSQSSLSRLEHAASTRDVVRMQREFEKQYVDALRSDTTLVVLDMDGTCDPTHGQQAFSFFNGFYDTHMYYPMLVFDGDGNLASFRLRPGNAGNYRYALPMIERLVRLIKGRFSNVQILVRGDSGFAAPHIFERLEKLSAELGDVDYVIGIAKNPVLERLVAPAMQSVKERDAAGESKPRTYETIEYSAQTWNRTRTVHAKCEQLDDKANARFVVSSITEFDAKLVYERIYCGRGQAENFIKDLKNAINADRLSDTTYTANAFRLVMHALAYRLMHELRSRVAEVSPALAVVQMDTLRLKLLKVAAIVTQSVRRIKVDLPFCFPLANVFATVAMLLTAA